MQDRLSKFPWKFEYLILEPKNVKREGVVVVEGAQFFCEAVTKICKRHYFFFFILFLPFLFFCLGLLISDLLFTKLKQPVL